MKKIKGMPITGTNVQQSKKRPFVPNSKDTSADAQSLISEPPTPFKDSLKTPQMPAGSGGSYGSNLPDRKPRPGLQRSAAPSLPPNGPMGQRKPINQSGQIGGRTGVKRAPRRRGDNGQGYPAKPNASFYGE
ncbi:MAG: hypothetical protein JO356_08740 [Acidobacteria bacterium]|nr:hypothetical protein [Acidobacteriota bacterium]